ncbi:unnamed protein product [Acanthoscelides obtectus]|uniref:Uncharacterized protein n=1 Tax=Acanthoscelides obtectus TaxID=200917 RepID=A0A9P0QIU8_ACAOB|nr:unnamed protein product [Acanthoscelides obtectus]CAK1686869.1 Apoptosis inhibitor 5 [Acanthoscelides obtectus]
MFQIRISAMKVLPAICKDSKEYVPKVTDILAQLLQLDESDHNTPTNTLSQIYKEDPVGTLKTVFNHVSSTDDATEREKCLQFIYKKIIKMEEKLTSEIYDLLLEEGKKIIPVSWLS